MTQPELPNMPAPVFEFSEQDKWPMPPPLKGPVFVFPDAPTFGHIEFPKFEDLDLDSPPDPDVARFDWPNSVPPVGVEWLCPPTAPIHVTISREPVPEPEPLRQSRMESFIEVCINTAIGLCISVVANQLVFPLFGFHPSLGENVLISVIYTAISIARGYAVRRWFERRIKRAAHALASKA